MGVYEREGEENVVTMANVAPFDRNVDGVILVITTSAKETNKSETDYGLTVLA